MMLPKSLLLAGFLTLGTAVPALAAGTLNVALYGEPGPLDPAVSTSAIDNDPLTAICDRLIDTDSDLHPIPELATSWDWSADNLTLTLHLRSGVKFQDGTDFNADAVKINLERFKTMLASVRKAELKPISSIEVVDPLTVKLHLSEPYVPLVTFLTNRSGMMLSPKAIQEFGDNVGSHPVCTGPFSFTERVAQDRIVVDRFPGYWNASNIFVDRIVYRPMQSSQTRLANLQSGQLDIIDQVPPTDVPTIKRNPKLQVVQHGTAAYRYLVFNTQNGPRANSPWGTDRRVRQAFDKAIDRDALNQVVFGGLFAPNNQAELVHSTYWDPDYPVTGADVEGAKALLKQAGVTKPSLTLQIQPNPIDAQIAEVIQSMVNAAGFDLKIRQLETNSANAADTAGDFDLALFNWSGRSDPDANVSVFIGCGGFSNFGHYCNPDLETLLKAGRQTPDVAQRQAIYRKVVALYRTEMPFVILYNPTQIWGLSDRVVGFTPNADGLVRPQGIKLTR
jgi:peptide/nickel transport system substrate-binding protein